MSKKIPNCEIENIKKYLNSGLSYKEIGKIYLVSPQAIFYIAKKIGVKSKLRTGRQRTYTLNENFFEKIDSEAKAYFLGLMYADGYISKSQGRYSISLNLQEGDKDIIEKFKQSINSTSPLFLVDYTKYGWQNQYRITLNSSKMCEDLIKLGCTERKSLTLEFPTSDQVPDHLIHHFIRGYFDGDGGISFSKKPNLQLILSFACSSSFAIVLKDFIKTNLDLNSWIYEPKPNNKISSLRISGRNQCFKFLEWIYQDVNFFLQRKRDKYNEIKKLFIERDLNHRNNFYSRYLGVSFIKVKNRFGSTIRYLGKNLRIGSGYKNEVDAAIAYDKKSIELFGE